MVKYSSLAKSKAPNYGVSLKDGVSARCATFALEVREVHARRTRLTLLSSIARAPVRPAFAAECRRRQVVVVNRA